MGVLFGSTRGTPIKRLKPIATQRKQKLPRSLLFKTGGFVEFWLNLLDGLFKDYREENILNRQNRIF